MQDLCWFSVFFSVVCRMLFMRAHITQCCFFFVYVKLVFLLLSSHLHKRIKRISPTLFSPVITVLMQQIIMACVFHLPFKAILYWILERRYARNSHPYHSLDVSTRVYRRRRFHSLCCRNRPDSSEDIPENSSYRSGSYISSLMNGVYMYIDEMRFLSVTQ